MIAKATALQIDLARQIAHYIADQGLPEGAHLTEKNLTAIFNVSRTPVRGALQLLAEYGHISYRPNSGYFVKACTDSGGLPLQRAGIPVGVEQLYRDIIRDRAQQELSDVLLESDLIERYGCSRPVLRQVLLRLSADQLIEKKPGRGWQFLPTLDSPQALHESYRFRMIIECQGLLESGFTVDADRLESCKHRFERIVQAGGQDVTPSEFFRMNAQFHEMLAEFSGNRFIVQAMRQQSQLRRFEEYSAFYRHDYILEATREHLEIIQAISERDMPWAASLMRRHLQSALRLSE